jgi:apolipoprotein N-acyltransferase
MKPLGLSFLAGLIGALGFQPLGAWPLTMLALSALIWLVRGAPSLRSALARGWWFGVGQFVLGLNWIATAFTYQAAMPAWLGWIAVVLLSLYLAVFPAAAAGLAWRWGRRRPFVFVLLLAAAWIVTEWLRATLFTGFAWNPVGVVLLPTALSYLARWVGTYGLSGILVLLAGWVLLSARDPGGRRALPLIALVAVAAALAAWVAREAAPEGEGPSARIVQPNIGQELKWSPEFAARNLERLGSLSRSAGAESRLLIWPEAAITEPLQDERRLLGHQRDVALTRAGVQRMLAPRDLLLTGGITVQSVDGVTASSATNSVFAIAPDGRLLARYDKAHLVPYGEYLPLRPILSAVGLSRLAPGDLDFDPGPGPRTLDIPGLGAVGFQLCYEIIFSGEVVEPARRPAFIFNPSNDAWFGAWGPPQHLAQARLRALEEGLPVVRATPTGISAIIDSEGRLVRQLPMGEAGVIDARLPLPARPTLFARFGNALPFAFALLLVAAALAVTAGCRPLRMRPKGARAPRT